MDNGNNIGTFFVGVLLGATVGAATALLMAPDKGKRTRKKINRKLRDLNDDLQEMVDKGKDSFDHISEDVESNLNTIAKRGKKLVQK